LRESKSRRAPEIVQIQHLPQSAKDPTGAPLSWALQRKLLQSDLDAILCGMLRNLSIRRKQRQLSGLSGLLVEDGDSLSPRFPFLIVDLPQIQHVMLEPFPGLSPPLFRDTPVAMLLPVFRSCVTLQVHDQSTLPA
jgi:hypothetical protein